MTNTEGQEGCIGDEYDEFKAGGHSEDIEVWLKLAATERLGPTTLNKLLERFGSVEAILNCTANQLTKIEGIGTQTARVITAAIERLDRGEEVDFAKREIELADKLGVVILSREDERYPAALKKIYDPPIVLYVKGSLVGGDALAVAVVGSRRCSNYGFEQASRFGYQLGSAGFTVVSGMARGIDTAAHKGALAAGARTIAVQGCGLANCFPAENEELSRQIADSGAVVSELPLNFEPLSRNFPARNRIITGLSMGTLVIEASLRSGAMISAKTALDQDREVMAVPGKIDSLLSNGCHKLIKDGAALIENAEDVMNALGYITEPLAGHARDTAERADEEVGGRGAGKRNRERKQNSDGREDDKGRGASQTLKLAGDERVVIDCLGSEEKHIEEVIEETSLAAATVNAALISLRLKGLIKQLPGNYFKRNRGM